MPRPPDDWQPTNWLALEKAIRGLGYEAAEVSVRTHPQADVRKPTYAPRSVVRVKGVGEVYTASATDSAIALQRAWQTALRKHAAESGKE